tara:strand:- start:1333 stop:2346 length:1014 start_codon:yes stop_codon:yes gene_type:complete
MAFLDNSGDIILDAVLTEVGRRRMANGNFNIVKFALGDDEIDYRLYNKEHASGSAYYDLEILQTPVFEAVTAQNSAINYGLLSITRRDLLYMPDIRLNTKITHCVTPRDGVLTFAVNAETATKLLTSLGGGTASKFIGKANALSTGDDAKVIYLETGLDTTELAANSTNRNTYLVGNDLIDTTMTVQADNRFFNGMHIDRRTFSAGATSTESTIPAFNSETTVPAGGVSAGLVNYSNYMITTAQNLLYAPTVDRIDHSIISGPRGVFACFNVNIIDSLRSISTATRPEEYNRSGKVSQNVYGDGVLYDYIDTTINVIGNNSTVVTQLPIRLIRYASG